MPARSARHRALIEPIRDACRRMVRELGFMRSPLAGTGLSPSATHAILEIGRHRTLTASQLSAMLRLEKSSVSRMVQKLIRDGQVVERADARDSRVKHLSLTAAGRNAKAQIDRFARAQVSTALTGMPEHTAHAVLAGLRTWADQLRHGQDATAAAPPLPIRILTGYQPGIVGRMVEMQARYYAKAAGFGRGFESLRGIDIAEFIGRLDRPGNRLWIALHHDQVVGTIVIDAEHLAPAAQLRWFIVDESVQGRGIGRRLIEKAIAHCRAQRFPEIKLDTFQGLDAARHLYEKAGFQLVSEKPVKRYGARFVDQMFVLPLRR